MYNESDKHVLGRFGL